MTDKDIRDSYRVVFMSLAGEVVLDDLAERFGANEITYDPENTHNTAFNEGMRSAYLYIEEMLKPAPVELEEEQPEENEL